ASALVWANHGIVAVDGSRNADPGGAGRIARLDKTIAAGLSGSHRSALTLGENSGVTALSTSHGLIVVILDETISQTIADSNRLEIDIAVLVLHNLVGEPWNIVPSILKHVSRCLKN